MNPNNIPSIKDILKNSIDELNRFLLILALFFIILTLFIKSFILDIIKIAIFILIIYRLTSKNKQARYNENKRYQKIKRIITKPFTSIINKIKDKNVYKKCPKCKTILKLPLPSHRGINHAKCPNCQNRVTLFTLKKKEKIKVEVIKKRKTN